MLEFRNNVLINFWLLAVIGNQVCVIRLVGQYKTMCSQVKFCFLILHVFLLTDSVDDQNEGELKNLLCLIHCKATFLVLNYHAYKLCSIYLPPDCPMKYFPGPPRCQEPLLKIYA